MLGSWQIFTLPQSWKVQGNALAWRLAGDPGDFPLISKDFQGNVLGFNSLSFQWKDVCRHFGLTWGRFAAYGFSVSAEFRISILDFWGKSLFDKKGLAAKTVWSWGKWMEKTYEHMEFSHLFLVCFCSSFRIRTPCVSCFCAFFRGAFRCWHCAGHARQGRSQRLRGGMQWDELVSFYNNEIFLELQTTSSLWLFQLDDSKSLHGKWLEVTKHP